VSGGTVDAAGHQDGFPYYRSGSMWKNKHELVSPKMKKKMGVSTKSDHSGKQSEESQDRNDEEF
jgi:hypothetical protein